MADADLSVRRKGPNRQVPKLKCPACGEYESLIVRAQPDATGDVYERERKCEWCHFIYATEERVKRAS